MGTEKQLDYWQELQDSERVYVSCALSVNDVEETNHSDHLTVNGERYLHLLNNHFLLMLPLLPSEAIILQNGALKDYSPEIKALLYEELPD